MCNRSGLENEWDAIDEGTQKEIIETWNEIVFNLVDTLDN